MHIPDLNYECVHCGYSCQDLEVELSTSEYSRLLETSGVEERKDRFWLKKSPCGTGCHFLLDEGKPGRCGLHRFQGMAAKPLACREFPSRAVETPGGTYLGASFACRAIAARLGPTVTHERLEAHPRPMPSYPLAPGVEFEWERYLGWEDRVARAMQAGGEVGLWRAALETASEVMGGPVLPNEAMEGQLRSLFRGLLALAEGEMEEPYLLDFLQAHEHRGRYSSRLLDREVDVGAIMERWQEPWPLWPRAHPFFEHLLFRKYLLEGPDVLSRICSLPLMAQLLQFLTGARSEGANDEESFLWALRILEERLTFHSRGLERYLGRCGEVFLRAGAD